MSWRRLGAKNTSTQMALRKKKCRSPPPRSSAFLGVARLLFSAVSARKLLKTPLEKILGTPLHVYMTKLQLYTWKNDYDYKIKHR